jgi:hypothetical protein
MIEAATRFQRAKVGDLGLHLALSGRAGIEREESIEKRGLADLPSGTAPSG